MRILITMTHPMEDFFHPRPKSSPGIHTQESGDAGLSSNMKHRFSDKYDENALPVAAKGSFVITISKEERDISESPGIAGEFVPHPSVLGHSAASNSEIISLLGHTKPESYPETAEVLLNPSTPAVVPKKNFSPRATLKALSGEGREEGPVNTIPKTTTIKGGELDVMVDGGNNYIMSNETENGGNPVEPRDPSLVLEEVRNSSHPWLRAAGKNWKVYLLAVASILFTIPASECFAAAVQCYTCMEKEKCPNLMSIYDHNDTHLYARDPNQTLPECPTISSPAHKTCNVCRFQANVVIACSEDVGKLEVEASDGSQILNISPVCEQPPNGCGHTALIPSGGFFLILVTALVIRD
ncbi:uncharacterized protein LOC120783747 isoform X2 [Xiphias gladius]|uniref:uncharacterized protein LOC120783747 isoform X2 n=1 Tax=Xiphias gladius TaxID=8245 RepID=UPI001A98CF6C|nr:uncharacterized protein LOC120783747 isoform X2 [Xiphias gladius]